MFAAATIIASYALASVDPLVCPSREPAEYCNGSGDCENNLMIDWVEVGNGWATGPGGEYPMYYHYTGTRHACEKLCMMDPFCFGFSTGNGPADVPDLCYMHTTDPALVTSAAGYSATTITGHDSDTRFYAFFKKKTAGFCCCDEAKALCGDNWQEGSCPTPAPTPATTQCTSFEISVLTPGAVCQTVDFQQAQNGRVTFKSGCGYSINSCYVLIAAAGDLDIEHGSEFIMGEDSEVIVDGKLHLNGALRSNGLLTNNNLVVVGESGVLENENDGTFSVSATGSFQNKGTTVNKGNIANSGAATEGSVAGVPYGISNEGELVNVEGAAISNLGTIKNTGSFTNKGEIDNERSPQEV
jgi:hypothetical protein